MDQPAPSFPPAPKYPVRKRELTVGGFLLLWGLFLTNSILYGGFNLGFAFFGTALMVTLLVYLLVCGKRPTGYSTALLVLSLLIFAAFARSDDGFVKFIMVCFLFISTSLGLTLTAGQNRRDPGTFRSLGDCFHSFFGIGFGGIGPGFRGIGHAIKNGNGTGKKGLSILLGLVFSVPVLLILIPLLMRADAAFEGLMDLLPELDIQELISTAIVGFFLFCLFFGWALGLIHGQKNTPTPKPERQGLTPLTINTVLIAVTVVYTVYLVSQLAYFAGGFSGLLPKGYSTAEYARRGFFEMAWLCAVNVSIMVLATGLLKKSHKPPLATRLLCLFLGLITLFFVITASAKMFFYIRSYGLTRLRVLTEVIMVFLGLTTAVVSIWLFIPKLPYMKVILLTALTIGTLVIWADVDSVVARYNVTAYCSGTLETVDVYYLSSLGDSAVPWLAELTEVADPEIAATAAELLDTGRVPNTDLRSWNWVDHIAGRYFGKSQSTSLQEVSPC